MKRIIPNVVNFPNGCETVRYTACFVSMYMRAEGMVSPDCDFFCDKQRKNCIRCGQCKDINPLNRKHEELYNLYNTVAGFSFMQIDLSNDDHMKEAWNQTCNVMLRAFDWYIGFSMDFAGYDFDELMYPQQPKEDVFGAIKASIDRDIPAIALFGSKYQWVLITGYDDEGALYGLDGSGGYWGAPEPQPAGYDQDGLFYMPDWYEKGGHAFVLGAKKEPDVTMQDVLKRGAKIIESMKENGYYQNSMQFMLNDANFDNLNDQELLAMRDRIAQWIGQPIDQRWVLGSAMAALKAHGCQDKYAALYDAIQGLCWTRHDVLWIAWRGIGEYMDGDKLEWAKGLRNKAVRQMLAGCFRMVSDHDGFILERLNEALK